MLIEKKQAVIIEDHAGVEQALLDNFGLTKEDCRYVVAEAVAARSEATPFHPVTSPGTFSYHHGTAALRMALHSKGWQIDREGGIESAYSPERNIKITFQNVDYAAAVGYCPQAISGKGASARQAVQDNTQGYLFKEHEEQDQKASATEFWCFLLSNEGGRICAELSRPLPFEGGNFSGFDARIFVVKTGEWDDIDPLRYQAVEPVDAPVIVTRK